MTRSIPASPTACYNCDDNQVSSELIEKEELYDRHQDQLIKSKMEIDIEEESSQSEKDEVYCIYYV